MIKVIGTRPVFDIYSKLAIFIVNIKQIWNIVEIYFSGDLLIFLHTKFVGNKVKGQISKRVFQENKARQIFRKANISYPLIRTRTCAYQGVRHVRFSENLTCFVFLKHPF